MADEEEFDVVVIGGGPGGYATALYAAAAGLSVAILERDKVGGTCLHRGCIPAKEFLETAAVRAVRMKTGRGDWRILVDARRIQEHVDGRDEDERADTHPLERAEKAFNLLPIAIGLSVGPPFFRPGAGAQKKIEVPASDLLDIRGVE